MAKAWSAGLALLLLAACGCGRSFLLDEDERVVALRKAHARPLPYTAALAPVVLGFDAEGFNRSARNRFCLPPDAGALRKELIEALQSVPAFREIETVGVDGKGDAAGWMVEAWEKDLDFLVEIRLDRWDTVYRGTNGWFPLNLFLWFQFLLPSWLVPDEAYAQEIAVHMTVRSVHTGKTLFERRVEGSYETALNDFERGWQFLGIFRVPGSLDRDNWECVEEKVLTGAKHEFKVDLIRTIVEDFRARTKADDFIPRVRKRLAVVAGIQNYAHHQFPKVVFARDDAEALHRFLVDPAGGGLPERNVKLLAGEAATAEALRAAVKAFLARRAKTGDEVFFYFAGFGTFAPEAGSLPGPSAEGTEPGGTEEATLPQPLAWKRRLLPYDADPTRLASTSVPLDWILDTLQGCPATAVVILDTAFNPEGGTRSFHPAAAPAAPALAPLESPVGLSVIGACGPGESCGVMMERERGVFSYFLVEGLRGKADNDDDGSVSLEELFGYAKENTEIQAFVEGGGVQSPFLTGEFPGDLVLAKRR